MICKKCNKEFSGEEELCPECAQTNEEVVQPEENLEVETQESLETLSPTDDIPAQEENLDEFNSLEESENEDEDLEFINSDEEQTKVKKSSGILSIIISFLCGVLATLITIGFLNGTAISMLDSIIEGNPSEAAKAYITASYSNDAKKISEVYSIPLRALIKQNYNLNFDVKDTKAFEKELKKLMNSETPKVEVSNLKVKSTKFHKSNSKEYETFLSTAKQYYPELEGASAFATVTLSFEVPNAQSDTSNVPIVCLKQNGEWYVFQ